MKTRFSENWQKMNNVLQLYKMASSVLLLVAFVLSLAVLFLSNQSPVTVILQEGKKRTYHMAKANGVVTKNDVGEFIKQFIEDRYTWTEFNPQEIVGKIECMTVKDFQKALIRDLGKDKYKNQEDKKIEQYAAFIVPEVSGKDSSVSFDRILRINGNPLAVPMKLSLNIIQGKRTPCNPKGLYVNKIMERH